MKKDSLHKNNGGFKLPEDYFESFESRLSKKLSSDTNEENSLPNKMESGFKIPEDYFSTLENNVLQKVIDGKPKGQLISFFTKKNVLYFSGIAAMIAILISISIPKDSELNFNDIEIADIHAYFNEENIELSNTEIATLLGDVNYAEALEEELVDDEALLDYLSEEDLEDEIIFTE